MCVHVNNPSLTVPHVVSPNMPTKTAPVGSNPFEDDEDEDEEEEEEMALEQQTTVNHISVNREENKTLVIRSKLSSILQSSHPFSISLFSYWIVALGPLSSLPFPCNHLSSFRWQVVVLLCMVIGMALHTKPVCVCPSLLTVPRRTLQSCA